MRPHLGALSWTYTQARNEKSQCKCRARHARNYGDGNAKLDTARRALARGLGRQANAISKGMKLLWRHSQLPGWGETTGLFGSATTCARSSPVAPFTAGNMSSG